MKRRIRTHLNILLTLVLTLWLIPGKIVNAMEITENTDPADIPIFILLVMNDENTLGINAFYVQDTGGTGNNYLITMPEAAAFAEEGYEFYLANEQYMGEVTVLMSTDDCTYLAAPDFEDITPLKMAGSFNCTEQWLAFQELSGEEEFNLDMDRVDFSEWEKVGDYYFSEGEVEETLLLGSPIVNGETMEVLGICRLSTEAELVVADLTNMEFEESGALVKGTSQNETSTSGTEESAEEESHEEEPVSEEVSQESSEEQEAIPVESSEEESEEQAVPSDNEKEESGTGSQGSGLASDAATGALVGVAAAVIGGVFFGKNKKKKDSVEKKEDTQHGSDVAVPSDYREGTVPLDAVVMPSPATETEGTEMIQYQIRGMEGNFKGQVFCIMNTTKIGRGQECQIQYPQGTRGISGIHCELSVEAGGIVLRDLGSTYGTYQGTGEKLTPRIEYHLKPGDTFYLSDASESFRVENAGESRQELTPAVKAVSGTMQGMVYRADLEGRILFGRSPSCQVVFSTQDTGISTKHCILYRDHTGLYLMDMGSTNGTFFSENQRLKPNVPYRIQKGMSFFLTSPRYTYVVTED